MSVFVDASVFVAILTREDDADTFLDRLDGLDDAITSPIAVFESVLAIARKRVSLLPEAWRDLTDFTTEAGIDVVGLNERDSEAAVEAALNALIESEQLRDYAQVRAAAAPEPVEVPSCAIEPPDLSAYDAITAVGGEQ